MKKIIFAVLLSIAFVASANAAPPKPAKVAAKADSGVKLGLGGYYKAGFGIIADEDDGASQPQASGANDRRQDSIKQDVEVFITGETTLQNGLTVGALIELEGQTVTASSTGNGQVDDTIMYIKGNFGEIRVGDTVHRVF